MFAVRPISRRGWTVAGWALLAASAGQVFGRYLVGYPGELWQLDLEVYRDGAANLLAGYPVYDWLTGAPQFLPFTYPPFSALGAIPLALVPFTVAGWAWSVLQVLLLWWGTGIAFRPLVQRFAARGPLVQGAVAAVLMQLLPVSDGIRFGQVNAIMVTLASPMPPALSGSRSAGGRRVPWSESRPRSSSPRRCSWCTSWSPGGGRS